MYVLLSDVDDRKRAEETVSANERNLRKIIDTIPTAAWSTHPDGFVDFLNSRWLDYAVVGMLFLLTLVPTTYFGAALARLPKGSISDILTAGLPYAVSIIFILGLRDFGRYFVAKFYKIDTTLPYFIPLPFFPGTYGCLVQIRSPIPNRKAVFDLGFVASTLGLVVSIPLLIWGLAQSETVPLDLKSTLFSFHP